MKKFLFLPIFCFFLVSLNLYSKETGKIRVLILSGSNNHDWQQSTPALEKMLIKAGKFSIKTTERPDTLTSADFLQFEVVLSNWNSWPENDLRWPEQTEKALLQFIKNGGGFVTFHASSSAFYKWPEFQEISTAAWIMDSTSHGKPSETNISITNKNHPVTKDINDFVVFDELWLNAAENPNFEILGVASNKETTEKSIEPQPAIMVGNFDKGRIFHTILGHDVKAIETPGFQILLLRAAEWAATGKVMQKEN